MNARDQDKDNQTLTPEESLQAEEDVAVEESDEESFPGSDPPAHHIEDEPIPTASQLEEEKQEKSKGKTN